MSLEKFFESVLQKLVIAHMRNDAHLLRSEVVRHNGSRVVKRNLKQTIKAYARSRFGSKRFWPYLAYSTEIRGEFKEWIPYDYFRFTFVPRLNPRPARELDFKTFDYQLFGDFAVKPLFLVMNGLYFDADLKHVSLEHLNSYLKQYGDDIVIKEDSSYGGLDVRIIPGSEFSMDLLKKGANYVIQPRVKQHSILNELYPDSLNTFRVNTFLKKDGTVSVKCAWLRFGADGSKVDNITSGGSLLYFDLQGKPQEKAYHPDLGYEMGDKHKNTGKVFAEVKVPMFEDILNKIILPKIRTTG